MCVCVGRDELHVVQSTVCGSNDADICRKFSKTSAVSTDHVCDAGVGEIKDENNTNSEMLLMMLFQIPGNILFHLLRLNTFLVSCHSH